MRRLTIRHRGTNARSISPHRSPVSQRLALALLLLLTACTADSADDGPSPNEEAAQDTAADTAADTADTTATAERADRDRDGDPEREGLQQLERYCRGLGVEHGWLVIFDQRTTATGKRLEHEVVTADGRTLFVVRA